MVLGCNSQVGRRKLLQDLEQEGNESSRSPVLPQVFEVFRVTRAFVVACSERPTPAAGVHVG